MLQKEKINKEIISLFKNTCNYFGFKQEIVAYSGSQLSEIIIVRRFFFYELNKNYSKYFISFGEFVKEINTFMYIERTNLLYHIKKINAFMIIDKNIQLQHSLYKEYLLTVV